MPATITEAPDAYDTADLDAHARAVVADWPPLTPEQRDRLALLLRGGDAA